MLRQQPTSFLQATATSRISKVAAHLTQRTMSSSAAPWRSLFLEHVEGMKSPEFTLSTIRRIPARGGFDIDAGGNMPRARTCIFRGMFASLPVNPKNEAELNPDSYESDMPVFTTDVRMDKMEDLCTWGEDKGSGGGGPVEAVWWADGPMVQWRVRGTAYVLAPDIDDSASGKDVRTILQTHMRKRKEGGGADTEAEDAWGFSREITAHFGNLSPGMRGTFKNPPSGTPVALPIEDSRLKLGQKVTGLQDEVARANFRVVVIVPFEVDRTDVSDPKRGRRWLYRVAGEAQKEPEIPGGELKDGWEKVEVWP